jgi:hypothetical protein
VFGIFQMSSADGETWRELRQILPRAESARPDLRPQRRAIPIARLGAGDGRASALAKRAWNRMARRATSLLHPRETLLRAFYGYAHPHVLEIGVERHLYFHYCNLAGGGLTLDIGHARLDRDGLIDEPRPVFPAATQPAAWDGYFTADPFVLALPQGSPAG